MDQNFFAELSWYKLLKGHNHQTAKYYVNNKMEV